MKKFISLLAVVALLATTAFQADAKRFGSRSSGKTYKTRTVQKKQNNTAQNQQQFNRKSGSKKSMMGGILGGLLMGGLIASLLNGDGFDLENFQFMDFLMIAAIAFALFKIFKMMKGTQVRSTQSYATAASMGQSTATQTQGHASQPTWSPQAFQSDTSTISTTQAPDLDVPMTFPADFNPVFFTHQARDQFRQVQDAWNHKNTEALQEYITPELFESLKKDIYSEENTGQIEVLNIDATIVRSTYNAQIAEISVHFIGACKDQKTGMIEQVDDVWHLERHLTQDGAPWMITGITSH